MENVQAAKPAAIGAAIGAGGGAEIGPELYEIGPANATELPSQRGRPLVGIKSASKSHAINLPSGTGASCPIRLIGRLARFKGENTHTRAPAYLPIFTWSMDLRILSVAFRAFTAVRRRDRN